MNKTYHKTVLRTIRSTLSRFLAIFAIVALGVGFLAGLLSSPVDMRFSADHYYDEADLYDIRILSTLGLTDSDLEEVRKLDEVEAVMPVHDSDFVLLSSEGDSYTTRMHSLPSDTGDGSADYLNRLTLVEGRLPEKAGECVVLLSKSIGQQHEWVGQTLTLDPDEEDLKDHVANTFTVVGTVKGPAYVSMEQEHTTAGSGKVGLLAYTADDSFTMDYYTGFYLSVRGAKDMNSFGSAYEDAVAAVTDQLETLGKDRSAIRYEQIVDDANAELDDAKEEYAEKKAEADQKLADAKQELDDGAQEIADGEKELKDAQSAIDNGQAELDSNRASYNTQIASARQQLNDGYAQIQNYQAQLDEGKKQLTDAQAQLTEGYSPLSDGDAQLEAAKAQLDATQQNLDGLDSGKEALWQTAASLGLPVSDTTDAGALAMIAQLQSLLGSGTELPIPPEQAAALVEQLSSLQGGLQALAEQGLDTVSARTQLEAGLAEYEKNLAAAQAARTQLDAQQKLLDDKSAELQSQQDTLNANRAELDANAAVLQQTIDSTEAQFSSAEAELADARAQYADGVQELADAKQKLADGQKEYEEKKAEAEEKLSDADEKIKDAEAQIRDIEEGEWYLFTRDDNVSFSSYDSNADKIAAIATVFPVFFFLVAALVALTTMTRMVEEERQQIGTLKALGYSSAKIAGKYLFYAAFASVTGSVFGLLVGMNLFPTIIISAYNIMYDIPKILTPFNFPYALFSSLAAIACTLAATLSACWAELREVPARLMLPKAPKAGKRIFLEYITPIWSRMKFTRKVTARNLIRYKKRFFMTVIGISGCTALLVTGFGIKDSISDIVSLQFNDLSKYQLTVGLKDPSALEGRDLQKILSDKERIKGSLAVMQNDGKIVPKKGDPADSITIFVPSDASALPDYFTFRHRTDGQPVTFDENSVIITEKLAERHHLKVGDTITVENQAETKASFTITDICENYVYHYLYLSQSAYEKAFGEKMEENALLCQLPVDGTPEDEDSLTTDLLKCRDVAGASFTTELSRSFGNTIASINYIVIVLIISAGALAFVVLYNLTNINITEREKEIATIKVLGFYDKEVSSYIYRETAALTIIGTAVGLVLGIFLHQFVIRTAEVDMVMFGRAIYAPSYLWAALLTLLFSLLVNLVMHRKLKKVSMVESMKAPE